MSNINNGGRVFHADTSVLLESERGISLRDYFSAKAMQGMAASKEHCTDGWAHSDIAIQAYELADAMLRARGEA